MNLEILKKSFLIIYIYIYIYMFRFFSGGPAHRALQSCPTPEFDEATGEPLNEATQPHARQVRELRKRGEREAQEFIRSAVRSGAWEEASTELNIPDDRIFKPGPFGPSKAFGLKKGKYDIASGKVLDHNAVEEVWVEKYSKYGGGGPQHVADYLEETTDSGRNALINKRTESLRKFREDPRITTEAGKIGGWDYMQKITKISIAQQERISNLRHENVADILGAVL